MKVIPFSRYKIVGHSMEPTLRNGQVVWVNNWTYLINKVKVGDIVVFKKDNQELVKRVTSVSSSGVFLTGDNQKDSLDSKAFGEVSRNAIVAKVIFKKTKRG